MAINNQGFYPALAQLLRKKVRPAPQMQEQQIQQVLDVSPEPLGPGQPVQPEPPLGPVQPVQSLAPVQPEPPLGPGPPLGQLGPVQTGPVEEMATGGEQSAKDAKKERMYDYMDLDGRAKFLKDFRADPASWNLFSSDEKQQALAVINRAETFGVAVADWDQKATIINDMDKALAQLQNGYEQIKSGYSGTTAVSDIGIATAFLKAIDPASVARESEVQAVFNAGSPLAGLWERAKNFVRGGGRMPQKMRDEIMQRIEERKNDSIKAGKAYVKSQRDRLVETYGDHGRYIIDRGVTGLENYSPTSFSPGVKAKRIRELDPLWEAGKLAPEQKKERQELIDTLPKAYQENINKDLYTILAKKQSLTPEQKKERKALWDSMPEEGKAVAVAEGLADEELGEKFYNPETLETVGDLAEIAANSLVLGQYPYLKGRLESVVSSAPSEISSKKDPYAVSDYFTDLHNAQIAETAKNYPIGAAAAGAAGLLPLLLLSGGRSPRQIRNMPTKKGKEFFRPSMNDFKPAEGNPNPQIYFPKKDIEPPRWMSPLAQEKFLEAQRASSRGFTTSKPAAANNPGGNSSEVLNMLKDQGGRFAMDGVRGGVWGMVKTLLGY